jgi:hypothetical protein
MVVLILCARFLRTARHACVRWLCTDARVLVGREDLAHPAATAALAICHRSLLRREMSRS